MTYFTLLLVKKSAVPSISAAAFKEQPFRNSAMGELPTGRACTHCGGYRGCGSPGVLSPVHTCPCSHNPRGVRDMGDTHWAYVHSDALHTLPWPALPAVHTHPCMLVLPPARGLRSVTASIGGHSLLVATSHLESPIPPQNFYSRERQQQMAEVLQGLDAGPAGNVLFAGEGQPGALAVSLFARH